MPGSFQPERMIQSDSGAPRRGDLSPAGRGAGFRPVYAGVTESGTAHHYRHNSLPLRTPVRASYMADIRERASGK
jgi:hypothetical protein